MFYSSLVLSNSILVRYIDQAHFALLHHKLQLRAVKNILYKQAA